MKPSFGEQAINAVSELAINTARGGVSGALSGGIAAATDNTDVWTAMKAGAVNGAISGGTRTALNLLVLGAPVRPRLEALKILEQAEKDLKINLLKGIGSPVWRAGGLIGRVLGKDGITGKIIRNEKGELTGQSGLIIPAIVIGGSAFIPPFNDAYAWKHEPFHFYQAVQQTWAGQLGRGMWEQWIIGSAAYQRGFRGKYNEADADHYYKTSEIYKK